MQSAIGIGETTAGNGAASLCVTFGVTWGKPALASASFTDRAPSKVQRGAADSQSCGIPAINGLRGNFVETGLSADGGGSPKSLKNMVGTTGIEPVTPTMSR